MYRLWAKIIKNGRIINSVDVSNKDNISLEEKRKKCFEQICYEFDLSMPLWLNKHSIEFNEFKSVTFYSDDFIDKVDFDKLVIDLINDGTEKKK